VEELSGEVDDDDGVPINYTTVVVVLYTVEKKKREREVVPRAEDVSLSLFSLFPSLPKILLFFLQKKTRED
jgi:hypothetical protein